jgi:hypothetical protein
MPLTQANTPALVGGSARGAQAVPRKRWVKVLRAFIGADCKPGDVVELDARFAGELITANKAIAAEKPVTPIARPAVEPLTSDGIAPSGQAADGHTPAAAPTQAARAPRAAAPRQPSKES